MIEKVKNIVGLFAFAVSMFIASKSMGWITDQEIRQEIKKTIRDAWL